MPRPMLLILAAFLCCGAMHAADDGLVGSFDFEAGAGKVARDASPSRNDGRLSGSAGWCEGRIGKGLELKAQSGFLVLPQDLAQWLGKTGSLMLWIKTKHAGQNQSWLAPAVCGVEQNNGKNDIFWGWIDDQGKAGLKAGDGASATSKTAINDGVWRHLAFTRDMNSGEVKVYVNAVLEGTAVSEKGEKSSPFFSLGRRENSHGDLPCLDACLDEIRIYSRVLSADEIQAEFARAK